MPATSSGTGGGTSRLRPRSTSQLGRSQEGVTAVRRALLLEPGCLPALASLGNLLEESGNLEEAEGVFRRLIALNPEDANAFNGLGRVLKRRGSLEGSVEAYGEAIRARRNRYQVLKATQRTTT